MSGTISRRDFLKQSSMAGLAATTLAVKPSASQTSSTDKSRVVIVHDPDCSSGGTPDKEKIQKMMDEAIKTLSGKTDIGEAYEALFPKAVTSSSKIHMKRNDISGAQRDFSKVNEVVTGAFKTGCTNMLEGSFPSGNVTIRCQAGSHKSQIQSSDFLINCPVLSCHGSDYGVTLSMKNTMTYLNSAGTYHSANKAWLYNVSLDPLIKEKQVMSIMDGIVGNNKSGPGGTPNIEPKTLILSKDIVAVDYHALRLMEKTGSPSTSRVSTGDKQLQDAEKGGLGTCTPSKMEVIEIAPPYTTGIIQEYNPLVERLQVRVKKTGAGFDFILPQGGAPGAEMSIFDMKGALVWKSSPASDNAIVWKMQSAYGTRVPRGMYTYRIVRNSRRTNGIVLISR